MIHRLIHSYIQSSLHVAVSLWAFCSVLALQHDIRLSSSLQCSIFGFGWLAYQYFHVVVPVLLQQQRMRWQAVFMILLGLSIGVFGIVQQPLRVWLIFGFVGVLTLLYASPLQKSRGLRYVPTLKIFIVALCWSILALFSIVQTSSVDFLLLAFKSILWVLVMMIPLEVHDITKDAPELKTLPQLLGVGNAKKTAYLILMVLALLAFITTNNEALLWIEITMLLTLGWVVFVVKKESAKYITSFWVEAIPVLWLGISCLALSFC